MEDNRFCMSSFLMYRTIVDNEKIWSGGGTAQIME